MKVRVLIEELQREDPDLEVGVEVWTDGEDEWPRSLSARVDRVQPNLLRGLVELEATGRAGG